MNDAAPGATAADYKRVLQEVCDNRPSGTRGRLAIALGTNRSFVSQLVNPVYAMPIRPSIWRPFLTFATSRRPSARRFWLPMTGRIRAAATPASHRRQCG